MNDIRKLCGWLAVLIAAVTVMMPMRGAVATAAAAAPQAVTETAMVGDVDGNGKTNMLDALRLYSHASGRSWLTVAEHRRADMTGDGQVDTHDAILLYREVSGRGTTAAPTVTTTVATTPTAVLGIDVSYAQEAISWQEVKETEVSFAILRCGYGDDEPGQQDIRWEENVAACEELGIPYGAYFFCYARNAEEAEREAKHALRLLEGKNPSLPVFLDMEYSNWQGDLEPEQCAEIATVFCEALADAGYKVGVYSNLNWWNTLLTDPCFDRWYRWVAQYYDTCEYKGEYQFWQYTDSGQVDGIKGTVDLNYCYADLTAFL